MVRIFKAILGLYTSLGALKFSVFQIKRTVTNVILSLNVLIHKINVDYIFLGMVIFIF